MIDNKINSLIGLFERQLWTDNNCEFNGRVYDNEKGGKLTPEKYIGGREYSEKLLNDKKDAVCFFRVLPQIGNDNYDVQIYFSVNLSKLYPNDTDRVDLKCINDVYNVLKYSEFRYNKKVVGLDAFSDYDFVRPTYNMHPYFLFRFDVTVSGANSWCDIQQPTTYTLTMDAGTGGTIEPGTITLAKGTIQPINATANNGYRFVNWLINGVVNSTKLTYVKMNANILAVASFIKQWTLTVETSTNGTVTTNVSAGLVDEGTSVTATATPASEHELEAIYINDVAQASNPVTFSMTENKTVRAVFNALFQTIQNVFTAPTIKAGELVYADQTGNNNDIGIADSYLYSFPKTATLTPRTPSEINFSTEYTLSGWVRENEFVDTSGLFSWIGVIRRLTNNSLQLQTCALWPTIAGSTNIFYTGQWYHVVLSVKSGGKARLYLNGVKTIEGNANTFDYSSTPNQIQFGAYAVRGSYSFFNIQAWKKQITDAEVLQMYNNKYLLASELTNPTCSVSDLYVWYKCQEGGGGWLDSSGFGRDLTFLDASFTSSGWSLTNDWFHSNIHYGCIKYSSDSGATWKYKGLNVGGKMPFTSYQMNEFAGYYKLNPPGRFGNVESKIYQKSLGLPDYNNFWYTVGGQPNLKLFTDFTSQILNNNLFFDLSNSQFLTRIVTTNIPTTAQSVKDLINYNENNTTNIFILGDSESSLYAHINWDMNNNQFIVNNQSVSGQHSYALVDGYLRKAVDDGTKRPIDIATQYPSNPEIYAGYDTLVASDYSTYMATRSWVKKYKQVTMFGTNNPVTPWATAPDYNDIHYRLLKDNGILNGLHENNTLYSLFHFNKGVGYSQYENDYAQFASYINSINGTPINPRAIIETIYNELYANNPQSDFVLDAVNNYITNATYAPKGTIRYINGDYLIWVTRKNTTATGAMATGTINTFMKLSCNVPNTIVNVDGTNYDVYNPYIGAVPLTDGWLVDNPQLFPSASLSDGTHVNFAFRDMIWRYIINDF